jgi:hypothetical protein
MKLTPTDLLLLLSVMKMAHAATVTITEVVMMTDEPTEDSIVTRTVYQYDKGQSPVSDALQMDSGDDADHPADFRYDRSDFKNHMDKAAEERPNFDRALELQSPYHLEPNYKGEESQQEMAKWWNSSNSESVTKRKSIATDFSYTATIPSYSNASMSEISAEIPIPLPTQDYIDHYGDDVEFSFGPRVPLDTDIFEPEELALEKGPQVEIKHPMADRLPDEYMDPPPKKLTKHIPSVVEHEPIQGKVKLPLEHTTIVTTIEETQNRWNKGKQILYPDDKWALNRTDYGESRKSNFMQGPDDTKSSRTKKLRSKAELPKSLTKRKKKIIKNPFLSTSGASIAFISGHLALISLSMVAVSML